MFNNRYFIIQKARRLGSSYTLRKLMEYIHELNKPKLLLPILAKSLWLKDNGYNNTWFSNQLYKKACFIEIKDSLYYQITNRYNNMAYVNQLIEDGKQCAECDVVYERPHWTKVLCVDCFEEKLKKGEVPEFQKASGVEL